MRRALRDANERLSSGVSHLDALSPLRTLARGYAIVFAEKNGLAVRDAAGVDAGDVLSIRLARGNIRARVIGEKK
jgi:exodeoxyribonuclease VII large subunit